MKVAQELADGLKVGDTVHKAFEMRQPTAGDILDASTDAERVVATPDGFQLVVSPTLVGVEVLRRQVARIGTIQGPISLTELRKLSQRDLAILQEAAEQLESVANELARRGRDTPPSGGAGKS